MRADEQRAAAAGTGLTAALARYVADAPNSWSPLARTRARAAFEDTVACMVAGAGDTGAAAVRQLVAGYGDGPCLVVGNGSQRAAAPFAALANGMSAHVLDFDDNYLPGLTHASAVLVPALLALGEAHALSGAQVLDAYLVGLQAHAALGRAVGRGHYDAGWHSTATVGCIGTAAACARLLGLDAAAATDAISLGTSMAAGPKVQFGSPAKPFHAGMAAKNAVLAASLAAGGLSGRADAIEGERGFLDLCANGDTSGCAAALAELDGPPAIERYGLAPKLYPCCGSAHRVLDGVLALRNAHGFRAESVVRVDTLIGYGNRRNLCYDNPTQEMEARFSMPYCVAVALRYGQVVLSDFTPAAVARPEVRSLFDRVHTRAMAADAEGRDPTFRTPHEVRITLSDGQVLETAVGSARGSADNPFDDADRALKWRDCCEGFLPPADFGGARAAVEALDGLPSIRDLTTRLGFIAGADSGERFAGRPRRAAS